MEIIYNSEVLEQKVKELKNAGKSIGFTPTMGALHEGHYSLIEQSLSETDISICSIFVNPTQFNNSDDLKKYPRTLEEDCIGLEKAGCHIVFAPSIDEIYPNGPENYKVELDLNGLDQRMEGEHRPGHFEGVVQVVKRLIDIAGCDRLYMGQKDFQQFTIIQHMIDRLHMPVRLVVCATLRENDGLAMSSRNRRLTPYQREKASIIYRVLNKAKEWIQTKSIEEIEATAMEYMAIPDFKPEYFSLIDGRTLLPLESMAEGRMIVACTAVWAGEVRLIDNMILRSN